MGDIGSRLSGVTPLAWLLVILAAVVGYGAKKIVALLKVPQEKQEKAIVFCKAASMLLALGGLLLVLFA